MYASVSKLHATQGRHCFVKNSDIYLKTRPLVGTGVNCIGDKRVFLIFLFPDKFCIRYISTTLIPPLQQKCPVIMHISTVFNLSSLTDIVYVY